MLAGFVHELAGRGIERNQTVLGSANEHVVQNIAIDIVGCYEPGDLLAVRNAQLAVAVRRDLRALIGQIDLDGVIGEAATAVADAHNE